MRDMATCPARPARVLGDRDHVSLCEALDRVLNKGAVVVGEMTISVADIDLIYLGLQVVLTSIETARKQAIGIPTNGGRPSRAAGEIG